MLILHSRVITVRSIKNALSAAKFASQDIQTIGLSLNNERRREFALEAARNGAARFPDIGRMTYFDSPWMVYFNTTTSKAYFIGRPIHIELSN